MVEEALILTNCHGHKIPDTCWFSIRLLSWRANMENQGSS